MKNIKKVCQTCKKEFYIYPCEEKEGRGKYCSHECYWQSYKTRPKSGQIRKCLVCGKTFYAIPANIKNGNSKYCSHECFGLGTRTRKRVMRKCLNCGRQFEVVSTAIGRRACKYCSLECRNEYYRKDKTFKGENCRFWKGGITPLARAIRRSSSYRQWRKAIFARDNFTCVLCGRRGGRLEADHYPVAFASILAKSNVKSLEEAINFHEFWNTDNGRTLCFDCHRLTRRKQEVMSEETKNRCQEDMENNFESLRPEVVVMRAREASKEATPRQRSREEQE